MKILALSGRMGVGKTYVANHYLFPRGYRPWALADHFKNWIVGQGKASFDDVFYHKPPEVRTLLQQVGTEQGRNIYGNDVWVDTMFSWLRLISETWKCDQFVITDCRFENEVKAIQERGGKVIRITSPHRNAIASAGLEPHISELALPDTNVDNFYDGVLFNDIEYKHTIHSQLKNILDSEWYSHD